LCPKSKRMRFVLGIISLSLLFTSCSRYSYQYLQLSSTDIPLHDPNRFVVENDTFRVVYDFRGEDAALKISIVNKSNQAMLVDWTQGSMDIDNKGYSLFTKKKKKDPDDNVYDPTGEGVEMISVGSSINKYCRQITRGKFVSRSGLTFTTEEITVDDHVRRIKRAQLDKSNSPLSIRVRLSLKVADTGKTPRILDHSFFLSGLMATTIAPQKLPMKDQEHSAVLQRTTLTGTTITVIGSVVTLGIIILLEQLKGEEDE
jgi:hypothetical protein